MAYSIAVCAFVTQAAIDSIDLVLHKYSDFSTRRVFEKVE